MSKTLLVIHTPPPYGGGEIQAQHLKDYFKNKPNYIIYDYSRKSHKRSDWSKPRISTLTHGVYWILKVCWLLIVYKPKKLYFTLPKGFFAFLRNAAVIPLAKLLNIKILGELPGMSFPFLSNPNTVKYKIGLYFLSKVDEIRFLTNSILVDHSRFGLKKTVVINNGIEVPKNYIVDSDAFFAKKLQLIYIGSLEFSKGLFNSLRAINLCKDVGLNIHFNLVGSWLDETEKAKSLEYLIANSLQEYVSIHGVKTGTEKWDLFCNSAILVHPTFWDGVPLSILEALCLGIPIISTTVGGIPDTIQDNINGTLLSKNTPENIAFAIKSYYNNRHLLKEISTVNQRLFKQKFEVNIFLRKMEEWLT